MNLPTLPVPAQLSLVAALVLALAWGIYWHWSLKLERRRIESLAEIIDRITPGSQVDLGRIAPRLLVLTGAINQLLLRVTLAERSAAREFVDQFAALGDSVSEAVLVHTEVIVYANQQFARLVGVERDALIGRKLAQLVPAEYADLVAGNIRRQLRREPAPQRYEITVAGQGQETRLEISSTVIGFESQNALLLTGVVVVPAEASAAPAVTRVPGTELTLAAIPTGIILTADDGTIRYVNPAAEHLLGEVAEHLVHRRLESVITLADTTDQRLLLDPVRQALRSGATVSLADRVLAVTRPDGSERAVELTASPLHRNNTLAGCVVVLHDVTGVRGLARQLSHQATHDALTGLTNRSELERRLQEAIASGHSGGGPHVLCFLDIERLRAVNDSPGGQQAGDAVLREAARQLRAAVRSSDTVARVGGDEFALLLMSCPLTKGRQIAEDLCAQASRSPFTWHEQVYNIALAAGVVEIGRESGTAQEALAAAEAACNIARRQGAGPTGRVLVYSARDESVARQSGELRWLQGLADALRESRLRLYQQTIVAASAGTAAGPALEVLVRLKDEQGGELTPPELLRAAERYQLMGRIDRWVVQRILAALERHQISLPAHRSVALNISPQTLRDGQFLQFVVEALDSTGVPPGKVCFEISERAVVSDLENARRFVAVLHGMGCGFTLDDFGAHGGSLAALRSLPLNHVKIDGSLVRELSRDAVNQALVGSMVKLARSLGFKVIAAPVEDPATLESVRALGVDYVQGALIGRPVPLTATEEAVEEELVIGPTLDPPYLRIEL